MKHNIPAGSNQELERRQCPLIKAQCRIDCLFYKSPNISNDFYVGKELSHKGVCLHYNIKIDVTGNPEKYKENDK